MDFYKKLFEKTGQAAIFVDAAFDICEFNDAAVQMFGSDIVVGVSFNEVANLSYVDKIDKTVLKDLRKMGSWKGMASSFSPNQKISMLTAEYHRVSDEAAENILGLTKNQMLGLTSIDPSWRCIHEDGSEFSGHTHPAMVCFNTGKPVRNVVMGVYKPDNRISWIVINSESIFDRTSSKPASVIT